MVAAAETMHATCIAVAGRAVLLRGPSGSGKSDLALRCLGLGCTSLLPVLAELVADDRVSLRRDGRRLLASAPRTIAGKLEVRGVGILELPAATEAQVVLVADLEPGKPKERLPDVLPLQEFLGIRIPVLEIDPFEASAALKVLLAINTFGVATLP